MSSQRDTHEVSEQLISRLTDKEERLLRDSMIRDLAPARFSSITREPPQPSLGVLPSLPIELLLHIFSFLDFQSLSRLSQVSLKGKELVETLPEYVEMMGYAPEALTALGRTRLIHHHAAPLLRQALRSSRCVFCQRFAGYLFLPTCERICHECHRVRWDANVIEAARAEWMFALENDGLGDTPILHSIPGSYSPNMPGPCSSRLSNPLRFELVSLSQAKRRAIQVHGSVDSLIASIPSQQRSGWSFLGLESGGSSALREYLQPSTPELSRTRVVTTPAGAHHFGVGSIRFPYVTERGHADRGRLCLGCQVVRELEEQHLLPADVESQLAGPDVSLEIAFESMAAQLRDRDDFMEHIKHCYGVHRLLVFWGEAT